MRKKSLLWIGGGVLIALGAASWGPIVSIVEQPKYNVVERDNNIEIRDYGSMIVAETDVAGQRSAAISAGFRIIAAYIFGDNVSSQKIAMTAPVAERAGQKIAMTAPVTQQADGATWQVRFVMPASYTMATLPKPKNPAVKLKEISAQRFAVIRFSGKAGEDSLKRHTDELEAFMKARDLKPLSAPTYAFYNPPWTLPFLRRNEIMIEIAR
jgi:SOUL heme-binding protein